MPWYKQYLSIYNRPFDEVPDSVIEETRRELAARQSDSPIATIAVIAYNEETRLQACLWALSHIECKVPIEIIGIDNDSTDRTREIFQLSGIPFYVEHQHSCGYARRCGLEHARGKYYFDADADTLYPPLYHITLIRKLQQPNVAGVSATWGYFPDEQHSRFALWCYETIRNLFLRIQAIQRPELSVRGLVFAYNRTFIRPSDYRVDIVRGEDGSMALTLKQFGRICFIYSRKARAITGYGTIGNQSVWQSLKRSISIQWRGIIRIFYPTEHYNDSPDNLVKHDE